MASPKKNTKQANATKKTSRIGKKKQAEMIEKYRPMIERHLLRHIERNKPRYKRPELFFPSIAPPEDLSEPPSSFESCPVCRHLPYASNIKAQPRLTLTEKNAEKYLRELGFSDYFVEHYLEAFRNKKTEARENRKSAWGIPNTGDFIPGMANIMLLFDPWLTFDAIDSILKTLLTEQGFPPGRGTIKKHLSKYFKSHSPTSIHSKYHKPTKDIPMTDAEYSDKMQESIDYRIENIRRACKAAIKRAEEGDI